MTDLTTQLDPTGVEPAARPAEPAPPGQAATLLGSIESITKLVDQLCRERDDVETRMATAGGRRLAREAEARRRYNEALALARQELNNSLAESEDDFAQSMRELELAHEQATGRLEAMEGARSRLLRTPR